MYGLPTNKHIRIPMKKKMGCHRAQNMIYDFIKVGGDALRLLWRNMCRKISAQVDGELLPANYEYKVVSLK